MKLSPLEIRILLKCREKPLQKKYISQYYARYSASERKKALDMLTNNELLTANCFPKIEARKPPTIYEITAKGKKWLSIYEENYPL